MILVDTSVWIDHLRGRESPLADYLSQAIVATHPFIIGELALGNLSRRDDLLLLLGNLPQVPTVTTSEVLDFIAKNRLFGLGIGYIDAHLLAATRLAHGCRLLTRDKRLANVAIRLGVALLSAH